MQNSKTQPFFDITSYHDFLSPDLAQDLLVDARPVVGLAELVQVGEGGGLETKESLQFLVHLFSEIKEDLASVLKQRQIDRKFLDERVRACSEFNDEHKRSISDADYVTALGLQDSSGRTVFGPLTKKYASRSGRQIAPIPEFLKGPHVTLFGPPDSAKMAINAMNSYHRRIKNEPQIVDDILKNSSVTPMWGADDEDSKTPLRSDLIEAGVNLTQCFAGKIQIEEGAKNYRLAAEHLALPIKRFPGLALPAPFLFYKKNPIPLHLYDFALHFYRNWQNPKALVFYVPKLENEEEARYVHKMVAAAERQIKDDHPEYVLGSVRLMIVLENPRAILRTHEIMNELHPYFVGASLGWHDYLASTARLFKEDRNYRIPVKADPDIVIKHIQASHLLLADVVGSRGGIKVGGMYGLLPLDSDPRSPSFQMTLKGFIKDVIIQLKRDLTGFWVAHPDFVRLGIALVEAWRLHKMGNRAPLTELIKSLLHEKFHKEIFRWIAAKDIAGLNPRDPNYVRALIVADIEESDFIANNHPEEIRFNVFQSLQYLTDWLSGNGCVALPSTVNGVPVRVMDDLATAERSRWEVWHELYHGRFGLTDFLRIAHEEMLFIRKDLSTSEKIVQVKWDARTEKWYPIAMRIMLQLMTDSKPVEFATELLLPFTIEKIRRAQDPWRAVTAISSQKFKHSDFIERFNFYFEACGSQKYAEEMAAMPLVDVEAAASKIRSFKISDINEAAAFHGNIGEGKRTLDSKARAEQERVFEKGDAVQATLLEMGAKYRKKFGFKFLVSAKGKSADELMTILADRMTNPRPTEIKNAANALAEIAVKRMRGGLTENWIEGIETLRRKYQINSCGLSINGQNGSQDWALGEATKDTWFELASLSKTFASAFAIDYFNAKGISLETRVNELLSQTKTHFRIVCDSNKSWADMVTIKHLLNHTAMNLHYIHGVSANDAMPPLSHWLQDVKVNSEPGRQFKYSGGGFIVLEHLIEALENRPIQHLTDKYFKKMGLADLSFAQRPRSNRPIATGYYDSSKPVEGGRFMFPAFAAGGLGTAHAVAQFLALLTRAYGELDGSENISHDVAVEMLHGVDRGSREFMGAAMGLGVFVAEAGPNRFAIHQGANEGFRALFMQCFAGPDCGKGFVILCNGDNRGVLFIAEVAQLLLKSLRPNGINFDKFINDFQFGNIEQEQIVNQGYKKLIFDAFERTQPEPIESRGPLDPLAEYNLLVGAKIIATSNDRFARAENLISDHLPAFDPLLYGAQGKVMDSWESARHNEQEVDDLLLELKKPSSVKFISVSTQFHDGNHPEFVRISSRSSSLEPWLEILPMMPLKGHSLLQIQLAKETQPCAQIKVEMAPDGGLTRLGLYRDLPVTEANDFKPAASAKSVRFESEIPKTKKPLVIPYKPNRAEIAKNQKRLQGSQSNFASQATGAKIVRATNEHYGPAAQVISPYPPINMFDGLESARSRKKNHFEEVVIQLAKKIVIRRLVFDFEFFVNNNPRFLSVDGLVGKKWLEIVSKTEVKAFAGNRKQFLIKSKTKIEKLRVRTYPDGGINRIKVFDQ